MCTDKQKHFLPYALCATVLNFILRKTTPSGLESQNFGLHCSWEAHEDAIIFTQNIIQYLVM